MQAPAFPGATAPGDDVPTTPAPPDAGTATAGDGSPTRGLAVLARLRSATASAHEQVEARLFPSALHDLTSYRSMLAVLLALHEPLERRFAEPFSREIGFGGLGIDLAERRKAPRLREDLAQLDARLGLPSPRPAAGPSPGAVVAVPPTPLPSLPSSLGAFYVLEGSTLGGRFLLPEVRERLGDVPTGFLTGYGDRTGRLWKQTRTALVRGVTEAPHPPSAEQALVAGAVATFARLDALLDHVGWAEAAAA